MDAYSNHLCCIVLICPRPLGMGINFHPNSPCFPLQCASPLNNSNFEHITKRRRGGGVVQWLTATTSFSETMQCGSCVSQATPSTQLFCIFLLFVINLIFYFYLVLGLFPTFTADQDTHIPSLAVRIYCPIGPSRIKSIFHRHRADQVALIPERPAGGSFVDNDETSK